MGDRLKMTETEVYKLLNDALNCYYGTNNSGFQAALKACEAEAKKLGNNNLAGECLLLKRLISLRDVNETLKLLYEADRLMTAKSKLFFEDVDFFGNYFNGFAIINMTAGSADENYKTLTEAVHIFHKLTGGGLGADVCYKAHLCYYRGQIEEAEMLSREAFELTSSTKQVITALAAAELLISIGKHKSDLKLYGEGKEYICGVASGKIYGDKYAKKQAEIMSYNIDLSLGLLHTVPNWLIEGDFGIIPRPEGWENYDERLTYNAVPTAFIALMQYLCYSSQPIKMLNVAEAAEKCYKLCDVISLCYLHLFRAGAYMLLNDGESIRSELDSAVKLLVPDKLWLIAAEYLPPFKELLIEAISRVDCSAIEFITKKGVDYWNKLELFRQHHNNGLLNNLTSRELRIINLADSGNSNAEIAKILGVSINTVKTHLKHSFEKLDIVRRTQIRRALDEKTVKSTSSWNRFVTDFTRKSDKS